MNDRDEIVAVLREGIELALNFVTFGEGEAPQATEAMANAALGNLEANGFKVVRITNA